MVVCVCLLCETRDREIERGREIEMSREIERSPGGDRFEDSERIIFCFLRGRLGHHGWMGRGVREDRAIRGGRKQFNEWLDSNIEPGILSSTLVGSTSPVDSWSKAIPEDGACAPLSPV